MKNVFLCILILSGCARSQSVVPKPDITEIAGLPAHTAKIVPDSTEQGDYYIWSKGVYSIGEGSSKSSVVHIGVRIENSSKKPLKFDTSTCQILVYSAKGAKPAEISYGASKKIVVDRSKTYEQELIFPIGSSLSPNSVTSFIFHGELATSAGMSSIEATFVRKAAPRPTSPPVWIYDPFGYRWNRVHMQESQPLERR